MKPRLIAVVGPTATGKSDLAVAIAQKFNGEIISADSRQVYVGLDIGTGKVTQEEMGGIPHHLLDVADPSEQFSVSEYKKQAYEKIEDILSRGKLPVICGGTGLYVDAVLNDQEFPEVPPNESLRAELEQKTAEELASMLEDLDPERHSSIDAHNRPRLVRAIEIATALSAVPPLRQAESPFDALVIGLQLPEPEYTEKIKRRLIARTEGGMIEEAQRLHDEGLSYERMDQLGLEYRYLAQHLQGLISKEEMIAQLSFKIRQYGKRQMTWFKRNKNIKWLHPAETAAAITAVQDFLSS